ncbi:MAG: ATP-dependent zinc metalloprotease FtsH [Candidatus Dormibacteria bacterium]
MNVPNTLNQPSHNPEEQPKKPVRSWKLKPVQARLIRVGIAAAAITGAIALSSQSSHPAHPATPGSPAVTSTVPAHTSTTPKHSSPSPTTDPSKSTSATGTTKKKSATQTITLNNSTVTIQPSSSASSQLMGELFFYGLIIGVGYLFFRAMKKRQTSLIPQSQHGPLSTRPSTRFTDVAGQDEAVKDIQEIVEMLKNPERFTRVGAKVPRGVLLYGPPGTGKTLLARAVAGESDATFFSISASSFEEMFVGVGASRVRALFAKARTMAPAIIFIDEVDSVGQRRSGHAMSSNTENQTLNQFLAELDGLEGRDNVIVIASTNRPEVLDEAFLRPGRFDRKIAVTLPDIEGRRQILKIHAREKPLAGDVDLESVARRTPGMSGADLENILNEAALLAGREGSTSISQTHIDEAYMRVIAGAERKLEMTQQERETIAYHEGGHALVAKLQGDGKVVESVTIIPRGQALGLTSIVPERDQVLLSKQQLLNELAHLFGGRAAEEMFLGDDAITTGASNDLERMTQVAENMVRRYAMTRLAPRAYPVGDARSPALDSPEKVATQVDQLVSEAAEKARKLLTENRDVLDAIAKNLMEKETITGEELAGIVEHMVSKRPTLPTPVPPPAAPKGAELD